MYISVMQLNLSFYQYFKELTDTITKCTALNVQGSYSVLSRKCTNIAQVPYFVNFIKAYTFIAYEIALFYIHLISRNHNAKW